MSRNQDITKCASAAWFEFRALPFLRPRTHGTRTLRRTLDAVHAEMTDLQNQVDTLREQLKGAVQVLISMTYSKGSDKYDREYSNDYLFDLLDSVNKKEHTSVRKYRGFTKDSRDRDIAALWDSASHSP